MTYIDLFVSTKKIINIYKIARSFKVHTQLYNYINSTISGDIEHGICIRVIDMNPHDFIYHIWKPLKMQHPEIKCGFVNSCKYRGCVLDWPDVFRDSACKPSNVCNKKHILLSKL